MHWIRGYRFIKMFYSKVIPVLWATRTSNESWRRKPSRHKKNCINLPPRCTKYPHKSFDSALLLMKCSAEAKNPRIKQHSLTKCHTLRHPAHISLTPLVCLRWQSHINYYTLSDASGTGFSTGSWPMIFAVVTSSSLAWFVSCKPKKKRSKCIEMGRWCA